MSFGFGFSFPAWIVLSSGIFTPAAPVSVVPPVISGNTVEGSVLTVTSNGVWTGYPPPTYTYQWQNAGVDILGETASTYTTVAGDVGDAIRCVVTATNSQGSASANSNEITVTSSSIGDVLLLESGDDLLLENGDRILLET